ncbi:MAG: tRNA uridine-5-carboxymethylaminomethyl(34) synthesis GTPase MnmE [Rhodospirillaceae bacterium]|nr:tRNA uridine-5-carboxymethylaminomethyl(34) synthesis GTPase MnmE [Rhodospirillaceae bacterium]
MFKDTIYAPASGAGPAGIAVIRVSGSIAGGILDVISGVSRPEPRVATLAKLSDPVSGEALDTGLVVWFPGPASFTGEDVVEFQIHGGRATTEALCGALGEIEGCRLAEPGEFTRRAFVNQKLDLTEVEGLADLIAAETDAQRRQALRQLTGSLSKNFINWRKELLSCLAHVEAAIDFPDEDLPSGLPGNTRHKILGMSNEITQYLDDNRRGEKLREGFQIVIVGAPNVGKSSLLNYLADRDVAIVSEQAGTTRDVIEVRLDLEGIPVTVADTAGLRVTSDEVEGEGVSRARNRALSSDLGVFVFDASALENIDLIVELISPTDLVLINKADLVDELEVPEELTKFSPLIVSLKDSTNLGVFMQTLTQQVVGRFSSIGPAPITRLRHREALEKAVAAIDRARWAPEVELMAEDLRLAARELGRITGRVDVEDVLDLIFQEFCIGK